jgi:CDGSH-type Zn-finger protein
MNDLPKIAGTSPTPIQVEAGKTYSWCTCGLSEKITLCDGAHKQVEGMPYRSMKVTFEQSQEVWMCNCKQTKNPPFCDGSHRNL